MGEQHFTLRTRPEYRVRMAKESLKSPGAAQAPGIMYPYGKTPDWKNAVLGPYDDGDGKDTYDIGITKQLTGQIIGVKMVKGTVELIADENDGLIWNWNYSASFSQVRSTIYTTQVYDGLTNDEAAMAAYRNGDGISRSFFMFDLSGVNQTVTACSLLITGYGWADSSVMVMEGTQAGILTPASFLAFTGPLLGQTDWEYGWNPEGTDQTVNELVLNPSGVNLVNSKKGAMLKLCCREYDHDYLNVDPVSRYYKNGCYYSEAKTVYPEYPNWPPRLKLTF
jgi:hypothetical protein